MVGMMNKCEKCIWKGQCDRNKRCCCHESGDNGDEDERLIEENRYIFYREYEAYMDEWS